MKKKPIRYAVIGLGNIAQRAMLPAFKNSKNSELKALVSGDEKKLKVLGRKYKVKNLYTYDQYDECLRSGEIDAVYIALPNNMHADFGIRAAAAGIHVLCEKPLEVGSRESRALIQACNRFGVKLMTAYRLHFDEGNLEAIRMVQKGKIGEPRLFNSIFTMSVAQNNIRTRAEAGGGPLHDIGIYCLNAARYLFQADPIEVSAFSETRKGDHRFDEVVEMVSATMRFPENRLAQFTCSFGAAGTSEFSVVGTAGSLKLESAYNWSVERTLSLTKNGKTKSKKFKAHDEFGPQLEYFSCCIHNDSEIEPSGEEGLIDVQIIEALYRSIDRRTPIRLPEFRKQRRPSPGQKIVKPEVEQPDLYHAEYPTAA